MNSIGLSYNGLIKPMPFIALFVTQEFTGNIVRNLLCHGGHILLFFSRICTRKHVRKKKEQVVTTLLWNYSITAFQTVCYNDFWYQIQPC